MNLQLPLEGIEWDAASIFEHVLRRMHSRRLSTPPPRVDVQFRAFTGMNHRARLRDGCLVVRLSDLLRGAAPQVIEALAMILLAKLYGMTVPAGMRERYRQYVMSRNVEKRIIETRRARGRKVSGGARGNCFDLDAIFADVNARYFEVSGGGAIPPVALSWSARPTRVRLGHFDAAHRAIVISRSLDRPEVSRLMVEYIMYHEMLHVKHPVEVRGARRSIHTAAFRAEEKLFEGRAEARKALRSLGNLE